MHIVVLKITALIKNLNLEKKKKNCSPDCGAEQSVGESKAWMYENATCLQIKRLISPRLLIVQVSNIPASAQPFQFTASQSICWLKMPQARHEIWSTHNSFQELLTSVRTLWFNSGLLLECKYQVVNFTIVTDPLAHFPVLHMKKHIEHFSVSRRPNTMSFFNRWPKWQLPKC